MLLRTTSNWREDRPGDEIDLSLDWVVRLLPFDVRNQDVELWTPRLGPLRLVST